MIKCHLSKLMGERKIKISDLARDLDVHRNTITLLYYEKAKRIDFDVLDKLCKYFECSVGDLIELEEIKAKKRQSL
jgi:putative transcriptional regulator